MNGIFKVISEHKNRLGIFTLSARKLITANFFFSLFNPFYVIFSNSFIFNITKGDLKMNLVYSFFTFIGIIAGFYLVGFVSRKIYFRALLIIGIWLLFFSILIMFSIPENKINREILLFLGLFTGIGSGVYWSTRNYLTLIHTNDSNRDFFSGIDYIFISSGRIITPLIIGIYIGAGIKYGWFDPSFAYQSVLIVAFVLTLFTTIITLRVKTKVYLKEHFNNTKFSKSWLNTRYLFIVLGFFQGTFFVVPTVFIMRFIGGEGMVGTINSIGYITAIFIVYLISRNSGAEHRTSIVRFGSSMFLAGAILFLVFLSYNPVLGTYILIFLMFLTEPVISFPIRATLLDAIDLEKGHMLKEGFAHFLDVELFSAFGRVGGIIIFYVLYITLPEYVSLPIYILLISLIQFLNVPLSKKINTNEVAC